MALSVDPILGADQVADVKRAADEAHTCFETIIEERRRAPREDLVSALPAAEEEGDRLSHDEMLAVMLLILVAGNETTRNLIGNGMLALLRNPGQLQLLRDHPGLMDAAVEEMLRLDSPVQLNGRYVRENVEIGGKRIRAGQRVITLIGAANRDPEVFDDPDTMDIRRLTDTGTFATHTVVPEAAPVVMPQEIPFAQAALIGCGVMTGYGAAVNTARVRAGSTVAVFGCGGVGLNCIQGARVAGAEMIIAVDLRDNKPEWGAASGPRTRSTPRRTIRWTRSCR